MYDLAEGMNFDFLRNQELELLCFSPYTLTLHFGDGIQLQIESAFQHFIAEQHAKPITSTFPISDSQLMRLLTRKVTAVSTKRDGTLSIGFENGDSLLIEGNVGPYESYNISRPGFGLIVV